MSSGARVLAVLQSMNHLGPCSILDLHRATRIPRPAIYRAVTTLCREGYAQRTSGRGRYELTLQVHALSDGVHPGRRFAEAAMPVIERLQEKLIWPVAFSAISGDSVMVLAVPKHRSPFVFDEVIVGRRWPVLRSALGLAELAFASESKQRIMLDLLYGRSRRQIPGDPDRESAERLLSSTRRQGYGVRTADDRARTTSIAVPVSVGGEAVGAICVAFMSSAEPLKRAVAEFLPELKAAGQEAARAAGLAGDH
jgi:IclR family transcriptional regulator, mhp operon transcriptional activator